MTRKIKGKLHSSAAFVTVWALGHMPSNASSKGEVQVYLVCWALLLVESVRLGEREQWLQKVYSG